MKKILGSYSTGGGGFKYESIPSSSIPANARYCVALAAHPPTVAALIAGVSDSQGFRVSSKTDDRVEVHTGIMVDYKYEFTLKASPRGTDVFLYFGEPKFGWGPVQIANHQRNISGLTKAVELRAPDRDIHVSSPSRWIRPLYKGAGGYVAKAAGQTAKNAVMGCFLFGIFMVIAVGGLLIWAGSGRNSRGGSPSSSCGSDYSSGGYDPYSSSSRVNSDDIATCKMRADIFMQNLADGQTFSAFALCDSAAVSQSDLEAIAENPELIELFSEWSGLDHEPDRNARLVGSEIRFVAHPASHPLTAVHLAFGRSRGRWLVIGLQIDSSEEVRRQSSSRSTDDASHYSRRSDPWWFFKVKGNRKAYTESIDWANSRSVHYSDYEVIEPWSNAARIHTTGKWLEGGSPSGAGPTDVQTVIDFSVGKAPTEEALAQRSKLTLIGESRITVPAGTFKCRVYEREFEESDRDGKVVRTFYRYCFSTEFPGIQVLTENTSGNFSSRTELTELVVNKWPDGQILSEMTIGAEPD